MGIKRIVDTSFWTDGKVDYFSPEDKYFMLYLLTNPFTTQLGIYEFRLKQAAFQLGYTEETVKVLLDRFAKKYGIILYSQETDEIALLNFLRHSIIKGGAPVRDLLIKEIKQVKNKELISMVFAHIKRYDSLNATVNHIIAEYESQNGELHYCNEKNNDNQIDNDNDNDNDVSYHDTSDDTFTEPSKKERSPKAVKHKYGEYKNVLLTDEELCKLQAEYPDYAERIERLSSYIASKGVSYKSHYATIRNWARKDREQTAQNTSAFKKPTKADELNEFYAMAAQFGGSQ